MDEKKEQGYTGAKKSQRKGGAKHRETVGRQVNFTITITVTYLLPSAYLTLHPSVLNRIQILYIHRLELANFHSCHTFSTDSTRPR